MSQKPVLLCIASYEKGQAFLKTAAEEGCMVVLLTAEKLRQADWPFDVLAEVHTMGDDASPVQVLLRVQQLARHLHFHRVVALDEFDLEAAALVREEFRLPGMDPGTTRRFRDKLAMRFAAQHAAVRVPEFSPVCNDEDLSAFVNSTEGPWVLKPRTSASAIGIRRLNDARELWRALDELGDRRFDFVLERFVPGQIFHVDSVVWKGQVLTQAVQRYGTPPMALMQGGGVFTTQTVERGSSDWRALRTMDAMLLSSLGLTHGVSHSEYIRAEDGSFYFLETAARVGGAYIAELVEYSTGVNPWVEWARIEAALAKGHDYGLSELREQYAGSVICLARQPHPELSGYTDPEVVFHVHKLHHAGVIVLSSSAERVQQLVQQYTERFGEDFCTSMPAPDKPTS